jgi:glycosyltransferase involved in cell wall biosynthesis
MSGPVIFLVRSWPRLSQTFILNEVLALERRGVELTIFSLVRSGEVLVHPQVAEVRATITYLDEELRCAVVARVRRHAGQLARAPIRYARALALFVRSPTLTGGYGDVTAAEAFDMALHVAGAARTMRSVGKVPVHVHAHFAHDPALVGMFAARLTGLPFTFTAHARDLVQLSSTALAARARATQRIFTCCALNADYLDAALPRSGRPAITVVHHGVDLRRFTPSAREDHGGVPTLVSIGRLVDKKGFPDLLQALRLVKDTGRRFRCQVYGEGPALEELLHLSRSLKLDDEVRFMGAHGTDRIVHALRAADIFVLTPRVAADRDRDGIPNVLVEAMSSGLPIVTTSAGGVGELVKHGRNGMVAAPGDPAGVARWLAELMDDAEQRRRLGAAARRTVEREYDVDTAAQELERHMLLDHARVGA